MPRLHSIGSVHIRIYADDTRKHRMPHFHAASPDGDMVVALPDLHVLAGTIRDWHPVLEWAREAPNLKRLMDEWDRCNPTMTIRRPKP
jgi:hypothetical protein